MRRYFCLAFPQRLVNPGVLQRNGRLRSEHFENGAAVRREGARRQIVFQIENSDEFCLPQDWQAKHGLRLRLQQVFVGGEVARVRTGVGEDHSLASSLDIIEDRRGDAWERFRWRLIEFDLPAGADRSEQLGAGLDKQIAFLGARIFHDDPQQRLRELLPHHLARDGLLRLGDRRHVQLFRARRRRFRVRRSFSPKARDATRQAASPWRPRPSAHSSTAPLAR